MTSFKDWAMTLVDCRFQVLLKILHLSDDLVYIYLELSESKKLKTKVETTFVLKCFAVCGWLEGRGKWK